MTVNDFMKLYEADQRARMKYSTASTRICLLNREFISKYGAADLSDIHYTDINDVYDSMFARGLAQNTVFGMYAAFHSFFRLAYEENLVATNPMEQARIIRHEKRI